MKKRVVTSIFSVMLFPTLSYSQVGINTTSPNSTFDINISNANSPESTDGILIPRINNFPLLNPTSLQHGMLVFLSVDLTSHAKGFYYWDSTLDKWIGITNKGWNIEGNHITGNNYFLGTTNNSDLIFKRNSEISGIIQENNTSFGFQSLNENFGENNTAIGALVLKNNTTGENNVSIGTYSLEKNLGGSGNVAIGSFSMNNNLSGESNIAIGYTTLYKNTVGNGNIAIGQDALKNNTEGNENLAIGQNSLSSNSNGNQNIALGKNSLQSNETGNYNTSIGYNSLSRNIDGSWNTSLGHGALENSTTGYDNVAIGNNSLHKNISGARNLGIGVTSLENNTDGVNNVALGHEVLRHNTLGYDNVGIGSRTLISNLSGIYNTAIGTHSLGKNTTGNRNVAIGDYSLKDNVTGIQNTAIGSLAFDSGSNFVNSTAIGYDSNITANNQIRFGNLSVTSIGGQVNWTTLSDGRFKKESSKEVPGLVFINLLRPVTYHINYKSLNEFTNSNSEPIDFDKSKLTTGFIAQEVEKSAKSLNYEFDGVDAPKNNEDYYGLRYAQFVVPLVKAVQELDQKILLKEKENLDLKLKLDYLNARILKLEEKLAQ